jgi:transketolase
MNKEVNFRKEVVNALIPYFRKDPRYYLLVGDMGFGAIDKAKQEFPQRIINCGIMEQGTVGIAAGMSMDGLIPIVYSIVNFLVYRSLEQIRNDVVLQKVNVKFIATGANDYFKFLGPSHCCGTKDIEQMNLIDMKVYDPYQSDCSFKKLVHDWITDSECGYLRI